MGGDPEGKKKRKNKNKKHSVAMTIMLVSSMPTVISQELSFEMLFFFFFFWVLMSSLS